MVDSLRQGLVAKQLLTAREIAELEQLTEICNTRERLLMRLDYNLLTASAPPTDDLFLFYRDGQLVGYLLLDRYHSDIKEVTGLVHPDFRRQGIFRQLLAVAREECLSRGIRRLLFTSETTSTSGRAFLLALGAGREFAEHRMLLRAFQPRYQFDDRLLFREAVHDDVDELALILASDFGDSKERARQHILHAWTRANQRFYIATYGGEDLGCAEPVGTLRVEETPPEMAIYGFFVRPEYRGRGHGRQIIEEAILAIHEGSSKPIMLEVDTNNLTALNLYRSLGFEIERTYEYYRLMLE